MTGTELYLTVFTGALAGSLLTLWSRYRKIRYHLDLVCRALAIHIHMHDNREVHHGDD